MTHEEAKKEIVNLHNLVKDWRAKDAWHDAVREREYALVCYMLCVNGKDPGPWEMPPVPEGIEP